MEVHAKVIEYEHFLNERLRSDLKKVCFLNTKAIMIVMFVMLGQLCVCVGGGEVGIENIK